MFKILAVAMLLISVPAAAQVKTIMEGVPSSAYSIKVDTINGRVDVATTSYNWGVANVGLHIASNVVVDTLSKHNACVIYATGSVTCLGVNLSSGPAAIGISTGVATTAAFTGTGNSGSLLAIQSSSVAVLSGGLVQNFEIDSSSVNKVIGMSSSCAAGFYMSTSTYSSGVLVGGGCVLAGTGGGGGAAASTAAVSWQIDNFLGQVSGSQKNFTLSQTPSSTAAVTCVLDGLIQSGTSDYVFTMPNSVAMTTAPAVNSTSFFCQYTINTSTLPAAFILNSSQTVSGTNIYYSTQDFSNSYLTGVEHQFSGSASTAEFSGISSYTMGGVWVASVTYVCDYNVIINTALDMLIVRFANSDSGGNYFWGAVGIDSALGVFGQTNGNFSTGFVQNNFNESGTQAGGWIKGTVDMGTVYGSTTSVVANWKAENEVSSSRGQTISGSGHYATGKAPFPPTFLLAAGSGGSGPGTMRGTIKCRRRD